MARSWHEVKADKAAIDRANGRDVAAVRATARNKVEALWLRPDQPRRQTPVSRAEL